jgi:hypothetical protein
MSFFHHRDTETQRENQRKEVNSGVSSRWWGMLQLAREKQFQIVIYSAIGRPSVFSGSCLSFLSVSLCPCREHFWEAI